MDDYELIAERLSEVSEQVRFLENRLSDVLTRLTDVEKADARCAKLNAALVAVMDNRVVRDKLEALGLYVVAPQRRSPEYLGKFVDSEIRKWAGPIRASGARPKQRQRSVAP